MQFKVTILGFVVGVLVGLTGMGGGALMTPALILLRLARPAVAVGTDLVCATLTKAVGAFVHCRQKTVDFTIVRRLAAGSILGALTGLAVLARLRWHHGLEAVDQVVVRMLAIALMCVALSLFIRTIRGKRIRPGGDFFNQKPEWVTPVVGALIGFLASLTSVGSGSLIVACLVVLYPSTPMRRIVGSDVVHGLLLVGVSALGHVGLGSVDVPLLGILLAGSIPGVWLGSRMSAVIPERVLQPLLATSLFFLGLKLM